MAMYHASASRQRYMTGRDVPTLSNEETPPTHRRFHTISASVFESSIATRSSSDEEELGDEKKKPSTDPRINDLGRAIYRIPNPIQNRVDFPSNA
jgi:hypothetical protein